MPRPNRCQGLLKTTIFNVNTIIGPKRSLTESFYKYYPPFVEVTFTILSRRGRLHVHGPGLLNISEHGNCSTSGRFSLGDWSNAILFIYFFFQHFSCFHRNTRQHSDPHCASQSVVDSSSNKIFAPLPGYDWFLCWRYCSAAFNSFFDGNRKWQMAYSLLDFEYF